MASKLYFKGYYFYVVKFRCPIVIHKKIMEITRYDLCVKCLKEGFNNRQETAITDEIVLYLNELGIPGRATIKISKIKSFVKNWADRWRKSAYCWRRFEIKYAAWLKERMLFTDLDREVIPTKTQSRTVIKKPFSALSKSQKDRRTKGIFIKKK